jgi:methionyl-tRNA formyltransferase
VEPHQSGNPGEILAADAGGLLVACGRQALRLEQLQKAGGKRLAAMEFLKGFQVVIGETAAS